MNLSTKNSLIGRIADNVGLNKKFHRYQKISTDPNDNALISPVEGRVVHIGNIDNEGMLISKRNKKIRLKDLIGNNYNQFAGYRYINFHLSPLNLHFWVTPYDGMFTYTQKNEGKAIFPIYIGLEYLSGITMYHKAVNRNATIGSVFQTKLFPIVMIAVGSLNVNRIHTDYEEMQNYKKGTPCGYFSIGSSMLLCFPNHLKYLIDEGSDVKIGQRILI
ncbi:MAG: phosphatidylserine decarboxylase [Bacteroidales bacterium]|nr:phosphatidylserine decarboxylase [Bacteroidales bacterium]